MEKSSKGFLFISVLGALISLFFIQSIWAADMSSQAIAKRIAPVGKVNIAKANTAAQSTPTAKIATAAATKISEGQKIYESKCAMCHASGLGGAPKLGDSAAWKSRLNKGTKVLTENAIKGIKGMPAKGACMTCSNTEISAAVKYMVKKSG